MESFCKLSKAGGSSACRQTPQLSLRQTGWVREREAGPGGGGLIRLVSLGCARSGAAPQSASCWNSGRDQAAPAGISC
eukprot:s721_g18.t1